MMSDGIQIKWKFPPIEISDWDLEGFCIFKQAMYIIIYANLYVNDVQGKSI